MLFLYFVIGVLLAFGLAVGNAKGLVRRDGYSITNVMIVVFLILPVFLLMCLMSLLEKLARCIVSKKG